MSEQIKISQLPVLSTMTDAAIVPVVADAATQQISGADLKTYFTGDITFDGATISAPDDTIVRIQALDDDSVVRSLFRLDPDNGYAEMRALSSQRTTGFATGDWTTGEWTGTENNAQLAFTGATDIVNFLNNEFSGSTNQTISVNGGEPMVYNGWSGGGNDVTFFVDVAPPADPTTITSIEFGYYYQSRIEIDNDDDEINIRGQGLNININSDESVDIGAANSVEIVSDTIVSLLNNSATNPIIIRTSNGNTNQTWEFGASGNLTIPGDIIGLSTIDIDNRASGNSADINLFSADNITIQARDRTLGSTSEGGDINIFAGDSAEDGDSSGGDVIIEAGNGGASNLDFGGSGGFIRIQTGRGGDASTGVDGDSAYGGGELTLRAGDAGSNNGNIDRGAGGGSVTIEAGDSTGNLDVGGSINLRPGAGGTNASAGAVAIDIPTSDQGPGGEWLFSGVGNELIVPQNAEIYQPNAGNLTVGSAGNTIITSSGDTYAWTFDDTGNLTAPGNITTTQSIEGLAVTARNINADYGNISLNPDFGLIFTQSNAVITANTQSWTFDESGNLTLPADGYLRVTSGIVGTGASPAPSLSGFSSISTTGATGNITASGNVNGAGATFSGNITAANFVGNIQGTTGDILNVDTTNLTVTNIFAPSPGNTVNIGASGNNNLVVSNVLVQVQNVPFSVLGNISAAGNVTGGNLISSATIYGNVDVVLGNIANAAGTKTRMVSDTEFSYIQTGNGTVGTTGNIVFSPYSATTQRVVIDTASGNITATGNVTAQNFVGNISITGNVTGTSANVDLVAGSYEWSFDNTGNLTLPGNTFSVNYANNTPVDIITRFEGSWNVATGNSTVSFTVDPNESYQMWVEGNIPNGIIAWNATATVTNTNVPVVGAQYAWVYDGGGSPIDFTSIPNQFIGTSNTIVRSNVAPSSTTNRFDFGINNTSGGNVTVRYGWIAIS
jgi:hypothetical protein